MGSNTFALISPDSFFFTVIYLAVWKFAIRLHRIFGTFSISTLECCFSKLADVRMNLAAFGLLIWVYFLNEASQLLYFEIGPAFQVRVNFCNERLCSFVFMIYLEPYRMRILLDFSMLIKYLSPRRLADLRNSKSRAILLIHQKIQFKWRRVLFSLLRKYKSLIYVGQVSRGPLLCRKALT